MKSAATTFANWLDKKLLRDDMSVAILCGSGNNGGDGYSLASILKERKVIVNCYSIPFSEATSACLHFQEKYTDKIITIDSKFDFNELNKYTFIIDAIMGNGINRPLQGDLASIVQSINQCNSPILSMDIPSGVFPDQATHSISIHASETLSFQIPRRAFFSSNNYDRIGKWEFRNIGLLNQFTKIKDCDYYLFDKNSLKPFLRKRAKFSHKYDYGNHLIVGGQLGMAGAISLCSKASYRMGAGLVTLLSDEGNRMIHQVSIPEAIFCSSIEQINFEKISAITFGPGAGNSLKCLEFIFESSKVPLLIDADGLNTIAKNQWQDRIPENSIITPHKGEFSRLFSSCENDFDYWKLQVEKSKELKIYIVLKGAHTTISTPEGKLYFNNNGNPGMATAGSGDVLAGMIGSLLAQHYSILESCLLGVFMHGLSGDLALKSIGMETMIASDLIQHIPKVYQIMKS